MLYGNNVKLTVFNDAGPVTINQADANGVNARFNDWQVQNFYPESCTDCDPFGQAGIALIKWRLENDSTIREAFYETDGDSTNRFFLGLLGDPLGFRDLIVNQHQEINSLYPERYKRFIVSGDTSHTALQTPLFYSQDANGERLNEWIDDFLINRPFWIDLVEDFTAPIAP